MRREGRGRQPRRGCLPTKRSLLGAGGLYQDVGEEALCGRVPMEGLIPRLRFLYKGWWLYWRSFYSFFILLKVYLRFVLRFT